MFFEFDFKDNDDALYFRFENGMYKFIPVKVVGRDGIDYKIEIEQGIGNISLDGTTASGSGSTGGEQHQVNIEGGIGAVHVTFREE